MSTATVWIDLTYSHNNAQTGGTAKVESTLYRILRKNPDFPIKTFVFHPDSESGIGLITEEGIKLLSFQELGSFFKKNDIVFSAGPLWIYSGEEILKRIKKQCGVKIAAVLYDLIPLKVPQWARRGTPQVFNRYLDFFLETCDRIFITSDCTKKDLAYFSSRKSKNVPCVHKIRFGDHLMINKDDPVSERVIELAKKPFILFVSTIECRKNHAVLYHAYHRLCQKGFKQHLPRCIWAGRQGWNVDFLLDEVRADPLTQDMILILSDLNDAEVSFLYRKSLFCVYPSLYEGWGLPVTEALALGKVVVASDQSSLPEAGGEFVLYLDPWDTKGWESAILELTLNESMRSSLEQDIQSHYIPHTWEETGKQIADVLLGMNKP